MNARPQISLEAQREALNARFRGIVDDIANTESRIAKLQRDAASGRGESDSEAESEEKLAVELARLASLHAKKDGTLSALRDIEAEIQQRNADQVVAAKAARDAELVRRCEQGTKDGYAVDAAVDAFVAGLRDASASLRAVLDIPANDASATPWRPGVGIGDAENRALVEMEIRDRHAALIKVAIGRLSYHLGGHPDLPAPDKYNPIPSVGDRLADVLERRRALGVGNV